MYPIEICIDSDDPQRMSKNIRLAYQGGAQRVELCAAMAEQGLTPAFNAIALARQAFAQRPGLLVMIRPRAGDFNYQQAEISLMLKQIQMAADCGADGVVFGALNKSGTELNLPVMQQLTDLSRRLKLQVTLHRAFDALACRKLGLQQAIALGVDRVLTSGTRWGQPGGAMQGMDNLFDSINQAKQQIEIVIGGGINPLNGQSLLNHLAPLQGKASFHAYSGVLQQDDVDINKVRALVALGQ
jgi:copper homeostasis protein